MKQTILVTGASSGFGLMLAKNLHEQGYNVIGTSRNPEKLQATVPFKVLALDITNENSIKEFTKQLFETVNQLDVLVNNAGYMLTGLAEETSTEDGWTVEINAGAPFTLVSIAKCFDNHYFFIFYPNL